jgi:hypothetical protein
MNRYGILFLFLFICFKAFGQSSSIDFHLAETEMKILGQKLLNSKDESERKEANELFIQSLEKTLAEPNSYNYPFDSLITIARLTAPDNTFRIFNWHLPNDDGTYEYFGYIQPNPQLGKQKKTPVFYKLVNSKTTQKSIENKTFGTNEWYGVHYYKIVQPSKKEKNYVLLGWDGNTGYSNKKVIETLFFTGNGEPKFGASVFKMDNRKTQKRIIFEYAESANMSLKYYDDLKQIIFDHLAPMANQYKDHYQFYGPDLSFDAFSYKKGNWFFITDIDTKNKGTGKEKNWNNPKAK